MKDVSGFLDGSTAGEIDPSSPGSAHFELLSGLKADNQFLEVNSFRIRSRMSGSGTRDPEVINDSTCSPDRVSLIVQGFKTGQFLPRGVLSLTLSLNKSPVLIEANCGYLRMSRSVCVPFPTPGAPTKITRAASFNFLTPPEAPILLHSACRRSNLWPDGNAGKERGTEVDNHRTSAS